MCLSKCNVHRYTGVEEFVAESFGDAAGAARFASAFDAIRYGACGGGGGGGGGGVESRGGGEGGRGQSSGGGGGGRSGGSGGGGARRGGGRNRGVALDASMLGFSAYAPPRDDGE
jgi:hypothetical protein